jgi:hypothetical protein
MTDQSQVFEEREGMDEVKNPRAWKDEGKYADGFREGENLRNGAKEISALLKAARTEGLRPRLEVICGMELDIGEEGLSSTRNPRL